MNAVTRQHVTIEEIKDRLIAQIDAVVDQYAPTAPGAYHKGPLYFTLNPGRADRRVGSFCIHMSGAKAGRWYDYAMSGNEGSGDLIDLIGMSMGIHGPADRIREARRFLGLDTEDPATRRAREAHAAKLKAEREAKARDSAVLDERRRKGAEALWLSGKADLRGTPVESYLAGRGIALDLFPHPPTAIRYHAECLYYPDVEHVDPDTGEVTIRKGQPVKVPAMLSAIAKGNRIISCHRTYLRCESGAWVKHTGLPGLPKGKWVPNDYTGGCVRLSNGLGPRGGKGAPLARCEPGTRIMVAEGIENGLSAIILRALTGMEPMRTVAAGMGWNMAEVDLPPNVTEVTLAADNDTGPQGRAALDRAIERHKAKGRIVRVWRSHIPGEDLNDALRRVLKEQEEAGADPATK